MWFVICCITVIFHIVSILSCYRIKYSKNPYFLYKLHVVREYTQWQWKDDVITLSTLHTANLVRIIDFSKILPQDLLVSFFHSPPSTLKNNNNNEKHLTQACLKYWPMPSHTHFFSVCSPARFVKIGYLAFAKWSTLKLSLKTVSLLLKVSLIVKACISPCRNLSL